MRRGDRDEDAFVTSYAVLARGGALVMFCEGTRSSPGNPFGRARPGIGRLALESGAPVVPIAILGAEKLREWKHGRFPKVTVKYGAPFHFDVLLEPTRAQQQAAADQILCRVKSLHDSLQHLGHRDARAVAETCVRVARR